MDRGAVAYDRKVTACCAQCRYADRNDIIIVGNLFSVMSIKEFVFKINNRIVVANRSRQQALCVSSGRRQNYFQTWSVSKPGFGVLRVVRSRVNSSARRSEEDPRHRDSPAV